MRPFLLAAGDIWQCLDTFLAVIPGGVLFTSGGERSGMLFNILWHRRALFPPQIFSGSRPVQSRLSVETSLPCLQPKVMVGSTTIEMIRFICSHTNCLKLVLCIYSPLPPLYDRAQVPFRSHRSGVRGVQSSHCQ